MLLLYSGQNDAQAERICNKGELISAYQEILSESVQKQLNKNVHWESTLIFDLLRKY